MIKGKTWIAMFSQTGSEIANICNKISITPDLIMTNNFRSEDWSPFVHKCNVMVNTHDNLMGTIRTAFDNQCFITLHGYLRIIPEDICLQHEIYNGHPGFITKYPELKGINPQKKVASNLSKYSTVGSVVHEVVPEVDEGRIITHYSIKNDCLSEEDVFNTLKHTSFMTWINFFKGHIKCV